MLMPDPSVQPGAKPTQDWQKRLLGEMTAAIRQGQEQVLMVFSREGCPWCDRQLPVLERAIKGRGGGVLFAPLRVFVFDAGEFPSMAQSFNVRAFPTTMAWGAPGVAPMVSQGYLDDANLDKLLRAVAQATPEGPTTEKKKKRGLFR